MRFDKRKLADAETGYAVSTVFIDGAMHVVAASEGRGPAVAFVGPGMVPRTVATEPGGSMGFASVPQHDDALFAITGFYPVFRAENAGIHLYRARDGFDRPWQGERIIDLPFVHRIATVSTTEGDVLVAATVCGGKEHRDDWSKPGEVYAYAIPEDLGGPWEGRTVLGSVHRNHGMTQGTVDGVASLLVAGAEGVIALTLPGASDAQGDPLPAWDATTLLDHEVSEVVLVDVDGDGKDELAVIEPFHGNQLSIYKEQVDGWTRVFETELDFGHGLSAGMIRDEPVIVAGNRGGSKDLICLRTVSSAPLEMETIVLDTGTGTAGTTVVATPDGDGIVSSNPELAEYALYLAR